MPYAMPTPGQNEWLHLGPAGVCRRARCRSHLKSRAAIHQVQVCVFVGPSMSRWRCLCTWPRPPASSRAVAHTPVQLVHVCMCFCVCAIVCACLDSAQGSWPVRSLQVWSKHCGVAPGAGLRRSSSCDCGANDGRRGRRPLYRCHLPARCGPPAAAQSG